MNASGRRTGAYQQSAQAASQNNKAQKIGEDKLQVSLCEFLNINSRFRGGCAVLP